MLNHMLIKNSKMHACALFFHQRTEQKQVELNQIKMVMTN